MKTKDKLIVRIIALLLTASTYVAVNVTRGYLMGVGLSYSNLTINTVVKNERDTRLYR